MRKIVLAAIFILSLRGIASGMDLNGRLGIGPALLSFTDGTGTSNSDQILNGDLKVSIPFTNASLTTRLFSEEKLIITPFRESEFKVDFSHELGDKIDRPASYTIYGLLGQYDDKVFNYADNTSNRFGGELQSSPIDRLILKLGIERYHRAVSEEKNGFDTQSINFGYDYEFLNKEDRLDGSLTMFQQNHKTDTFDYGENQFNLGYKHLFNPDAELKLRWDYEQVRYDLTGMKGSDLNENKISAWWMKTVADRWYRVGGYFKKDSFPNLKTNDYDIINLGLLLNRDIPDRRGNVQNQHDFTYYMYKDPTPKYFDYNWNFIRTKPWRKSLDLYLDNTVYLRRFQNTSTNKKQSFYDDQFTTGVSYAQWDSGLIKAGPLIGVRVWEDPNRSSNNNPDDNGIFKNPLNYFIYGVKADGQIDMGPESELSFGIILRNLINWAGKPKQTGNEELILDARYTKKITSNWLLTATANIGQQINDLGAQSSGEYYRNIMVRFEYSFDNKPMSRGVKTSQNKFEAAKKIGGRTSEELDNVLNNTENLIGRLERLNQSFLLYYHYFMRVIQHGSGINANAGSGVGSSQTFGNQIGKSLAYSFVQAEKKLAILGNFTPELEITETRLRDYAKKDSERIAEALEKLNKVKETVLGAEGLANKFHQMQNIIRQFNLTEEYLHSQAAGSPDDLQPEFSNNLLGTDGENNATQ